ncbi:MAG: hypothetical protein ABIP44_02950 [Pseudoxanthomonas sp.]
MNSTAQRATVFALLVLLLVSTRLNLPTSVTHFGPVPDASWAAFFIGGFYLRTWTRWAFPVFMALAVLVDYLVISGQGMDFFAHYCMSAAYWFLVPAYFALWLGGMLTRRYYKEANGKALAVLVASLVGAVVACHLLSQGSFYWISDSVAQPSLAGWWKNYSDWFPGYLRTTAIYVGLAVIAHVGVTQAARLRANAKVTR